MAYAIQRRRGTATEHNSFTGLAGEITIDTTNNTVRVHDGSTAGGHRLAKYSEINTQENIEDAVGNLLTAGSGISLSYDDANGTLTITNTTSAGDIESVAAGNGLSGGGTSGAVSLALDLNELTAAAVDVSADSIAIIDAGDSSSKKESIADLATAMAGTNLTASSGTLGFADSVMDARISNAIKDEDNMASDSATHVPSQQSVKAFVASQVATKDNTDEMTEGSSNLYHTTARARASISAGGDLSYNSTTGVMSFTNDAGDISSVVAGTGLTGGGTSGDVTVNVIGGDGITANADDMAVDSTVVRTTGVQSIGGNKTFSNDIIVTGNFTVNGTTSTVNSTTVNIADPVFEIGDDSSDDNLDRGIKFKYNSGGAKIGFFGMDDSTGKFVALSSATDSSSVFSGTAMSAVFGGLEASTLAMSGSITSYAGAAPTDGKLLIGDTASGLFDAATLTAGDGIDITNGAGAITIAAEVSTASNLGSVIVAAGEGMDVSYSGGTATVAGEDATTSNKGVASFASANFTVSSGAVSITALDGGTF